MQQKNIRKNTTPRVTTSPQAVQGPRMATGKKQSEVQVRAREVTHHRKQSRNLKKIQCQRPAPGIRHKNGNGKSFTKYDVLHGSYQTCL